MPADACPIVGRHPRKPERRRKRRPKKKTSTQNLVAAQSPQISGEIEASIENRASSPVQESVEMKNMSSAEAESSSAVAPVAPKVSAPPPNAGNMSPRKQTLMRHKSSTKFGVEPSFVSEAKQIKKNRKSGSHIDAVDGRYSLMLSHQPMDEKAALFSAPSAQIVSYHETLAESPLRQSAGTLLAHGEFEIFQLHGGDVTYLACGKTFVYPLLPKLKILRTSQDEFVLPLVNPHRYWKIRIDAQNEQVFADLEHVLKRVVKYTNLAETSSPGVLNSENSRNSRNSRNSLHSIHLVSSRETSKSPNPSEASMGSHSTKNMQIPQTLEAPFLAICPPKHDPGAKVLSRVPEAMENGIVPSARAGHVTPDTVSPDRAGRQGRNGTYVPFFNEIPESPPSAPVSPRNLEVYRNSADTSVPDAGIPLWESPVNTSAPSITSAMASFGLEKQDKWVADANAAYRHTAHPRPHALANPFFQTNYAGGSASNGNGNTAKKSILHTNDRSGDAVSETSSMDSLLDEYEETVSYTRSVHHNLSRPQSTAASHISAMQSVARSTAGNNIRRGLASNSNLNLHAHLHADARHNEPGGNSGTSHRRMGTDSQIDGFPTTSLSGYDRARRNSTEDRSRRSSVSELYSATSNWMEPGQIPAAKKLASSKSAYSLAGKARLRHGEISAAGGSKANLNETYREIYRSITSHNLAHDAAHKSAHETAGNAHQTRNREMSASSYTRSESPAVFGRSASHTSNGTSAAHQHTRPAINTISSRMPKKEGLSSVEVFKLLSERDKSQSQTAGNTGNAGNAGDSGIMEKPPPAASGFRRLFGW